MICISVTPSSRKLAKVDMLNAARHCDIVELCLDNLIKAPDVGELISVIDRPILVSCRREQDGGKWSGSEADRIQLLRNAVVSGPAYVELDFDAAKQIPRFGETQRVVSFSSLDRPLVDVDGIFEEAAQLKADVVKFTWPTPTLDNAWPLLVAVNKKQNIPSVGIGLGEAGLTFSLLARRYGSPWVYAALEKGMEAHSGQPTVWELNDLYHLGDIEPSTKFVGLIGFGAVQPKLAQALNQSFADRKVAFRCLPLEPGSIEKLKPKLDSLKIKALLVHPGQGDRIAALADQLEGTAQQANSADLLLKQKDGWHGYETMARSALRALETHNPSDQDVHRNRNILILGAGGLAQSIARSLAKRDALVSITAPDEAACRQAAERCGARAVSYATLYDTLAEVFIVADSAIILGHRKMEFNPSFLRPPMLVLDCVAGGRDSEILREARERACEVVSPDGVYFSQLGVQFKAITGTEIPLDVVQRCFEAV